MKIANMCKGFAITILILGFIYGIVLGIGFGEGDNFLLMLICWVFTFTSWLLFHAVGEILELTQTNNSILRKLYNKEIAQEINQPMKENATKTPINNTFASDDWKCKKCGANNRSGVIQCSQCQTFK